MTTLDPPPSDEAPPTERATWRSWLGLALLTLPMLALATDISSLFLAMPSISADLQPGTSQMLWILHVYGFLIGGFLMTMGRLGDRVGRRKLLMIGSGAFAVLAVLAASSPTAEALIAARALLGVAGATLMPSAYSLLRDLFHDAVQRRFAIAIMFSAFTVGNAVGPLIAGVLLEHFWWGSVFLVNVPPLALLLVLGRWLLPEHRDPTARRLDLPSVGLSLGGVLAVVHGFQEAAEHGVRLVHLGTVLVGLVLAITFVRRQRALPDPLLDLRLFSDRRFSASVAMVLLTAVGSVGAYYLYTQYLQWVLGLTPLRAGLWTVPFIIGGGAGAMLGPVLVGWLRHAHVIGAGLAVSATGLAAVAAVAGTAELPILAAWTAVAGLGQGAAMSLGSDLIISTAPARRAGSAAAMQEVSGELGTAVGVAVAGGVGMVVYRRTLGHTAPDAVPDTALAAAQDSVSGAAAAADGLPATLGAELLSSAQAAFTTAVQAGFGLGAAILLPAAVMIVVTLRRSQAPASDQPSGVPGG